MSAKKVAKQIAEQFANTATKVLATKAARSQREEALRRLTDKLVRKKKTYH